MGTDFEQQFDDQSDDEQVQDEQLFHFKSRSRGVIAPTISGLPFVEFTTGPGLT